MTDADLVQSYAKLTKSTLTPEYRAELWDVARKHFPEMTTLLLNLFADSVQEGDTQTAYTHALGISLLFLAVAVATDNADQPTTEHPVPVKRAISYPAFGFLPSLT